MRMKKCFCLLGIFLFFLGSAVACGRSNTLENGENSKGTEISDGPEDIGGSKVPESTENLPPVSGSGLQKLTELKEELPSQIALVKETEYPNIDFTDDFIVSMPDVQKVYDLTFTKEKDLSAKECFEQFDRLFDELTEGSYTDKDKKSLYKYIPVGIAETGLCYNDLDMLLNDEIPLYEYFVLTPECYVAFTREMGLQSFCRAEAAKLAGMDNTPSPVTVPMPSEECKLLGDYMEWNTDSVDSYRLMDKEVRVCDAVQTVEEMLCGDLFRTRRDLSPEVARVRALELKDGICGYLMDLTASYKDVPFSVALRDDSIFITTMPGDDSREREDFPGYLFMLESDSLDTYYYYGMFNDKVEEQEEYDSILSFKDAVQKVSDSMAAHMELTLSSAQLNYLIYREDSCYSEIAWNFNSVNSIDGLRYVISVNALNGECSYHTQPL